MESRKAWRNRDRSAGESVLALLEGLRHGLGAQGVGLFDDDRADADPDSPRGALNFWDAFDERPCAEIDWERWYRELKRHQRVETTCGCGGAHHLYGFLIHGRWALLLVAAPELPSTGAAAIASSLTALAAQLPPAKTAAEWEAIARYEGDPAGASSSGGGGGAGGAGVTGAGGAPVWWVRKLPH